MSKDYVGMDLHQASTSIVVMNGQEKVTIESLVETKAQALGRDKRDTTRDPRVTATRSPDRAGLRRRGLLPKRTSRSGRPLAGSPPCTFATRMFVWRDERWQIVATHLLRVAEPQRRSRTR